MADFVNRILRRSSITQSTSNEKNEIQNSWWTGSGIVYCRSRNDCESVATILSTAKIPTLAYHAGLNNKIREEVQDKWMNNEVPVLAATIAFGMGVDKATVRFVIHWSSPQNLASYYQESGRAGRDGKRSYCRIYHSREDLRLLNFLIQKDIQILNSKKLPKPVIEERKKNIQQGFDKMMEYVEKPLCRHSTLAYHFCESLKPCGTNCDFCKDPKKVERMLSTLSNILYTKASNKKYDDTDYDLYEGGRCGFVKVSEFENIKSSEETEKQNRLDLRKIVQDELRKRRIGRTGLSNVSPNFSIPTIKRLRESSKAYPYLLYTDSSSSFRGCLVTLQKRESVRTTILLALKNNFVKCENDVASDELKLNSLAGQIEGEVFKNSAVSTVYSHKSAMKVANINQKTKNIELFLVT